MKKDETMTNDEGAEGDVPFDQLTDEDLTALDAVKEFEYEAGAKTVVGYPDTVVMKAKRVHVAKCIKDDDHEGLCEVAVDASGA